MIFHGTGVVWDKENSKRLCKFKDGIYKTESKREIDILAQTFKHDEAIEPTYAEMRKYCKKKGYNGYARLNTSDLVEFIAKKESK